MRRWTAGVVAILAGGLLGAAFEAAAGDPARTDKDPVFVRWLVPGDPGDEAIREYWELARQDQLSAPGLVDLGTMLFHRGYPDDAVDMYRAALDRDPGLYEAWFRIGIVKHRDSEIEDARHAYNKCLKLLVGHGWCNFYLGLLEEETGHPKKALEHYEAAFLAEPKLADPRYNPEVMYSKLKVGAVIKQRDQAAFSSAAPMPYLEPNRVREARGRHEPTPTPAPVVEPETRPTPVARGAAPRPTPAARTVGGAEAGAASGLVRQPSGRAAQPPGGFSPAVI